MNKKMILSVGEILIDRFPDYDRVGGAPFNFAYHIKQLTDMPVRFVSRVGPDPEGEEILNFIDRYGFDKADIQMDKTHPTGIVNIQTETSGGHSFEIVEDAAYDYITLDGVLEKTVGSMISMIYIGTLIQRTSSGHNTVQQILNSCNESATVFYDINLRPACYSEQIILSTLQYTNILKLNNEELHLLKNMMKYYEPDNEFIKFLFNEYPIDIIAVTKGKNGSTLYSKICIDSRVSKLKGEFLDSVGAGDAFAAVLAVGYMAGWPLATINQEAGRLAADICSISGAIPYDKKNYTNIKKILKG
ncbi:MAG: hypothetical protein K9L30_16180 [Desulfobacterales bacterium]|nr:hypothetical protein [Desulfobacterales bacterium]